jgi:hypothetical protein
VRNQGHANHAVHDLLSLNQNPSANSIQKYNHHELSTFPRSARCTSCSTSAVSYTDKIRQINPKP